MDGKYGVSGAQSSDLFASVLHRTAQDRAADSAPTDVAHERTGGHR